ncbi:benzoate-CoA ligase family protein [Thermomonospora cellulosilytica]|uniref:Benzoate-CoA ligase family protein n=1 Tax=Thermomonospora cellulosilytica TaxID=1411118 RepID=A0A7W3MVI5_9ACTN|nr:benzoate-CoA ligase family protein [Thermomonospora cellulosilytica]MBA9002679.1 benzoate-CoA ligase family protein [Thermomonospora cellulosilytica]
MPEPFNAASYLVDRRLDLGHGDRVAVAGPGGALTYAQLAEQVRRVAAGLRAAGLRPEERIVLFAADGPELLIAFLAGMRIGAVPVPVSTMYNGAELGRLLADSRARMLLVTPQFAAAAQEALAVSEVRDVVLAGDAPVEVPAGVRAWAWDKLLAAGDDESVYGTWDESPAFWLYTSGTTGTPKAAMHRHGSVRHVAECYAAQVLGVTAEDRCFSVARLFFAYGLGNAALFPLSAGAATILDPARPTPAGVTERLTADRPTLFFAVPTFYAALLDADVPREAFASVRLAVSAGEPLPPELYRRFTERYGVELLDGIGSTEALHIFLSNRPGEVRPGTSGRPVPGYEVKVVDETGAEVPPGEPGDLLIRGPSLTTGYWCRTEVTRRAFQGEWMRTGDKYVRSEDGYYACLGRSDDMIKAGGIWVSPAEVEQCLVEHPSVAEVAVVAVPDGHGLDKPVACVVPASGATVDAGELIAHCRERLAAFKRPRQVVVVDELPKTATGKLRRFAIRELARELVAEKGTPA